jgi:hypothetical protein
MVLHCEPPHHLPVAQVRPTPASSFSSVLFFDATRSFPRRLHRLHFVKCNGCGSTRSVPAIKMGFVAQVPSYCTLGCAATHCVRCTAIRLTRHTSTLHPYPTLAAPFFACNSPSLSLCNVSMMFFIKICSYQRSHDCCMRHKSLLRRVHLPVPRALFGAFWHAATSFPTGQAKSYSAWYLTYIA